MPRKKNVMSQRKEVPFPCHLVREIVQGSGFKISDTELSRVSGVPRTTIHYLCTHPSANPRWDTLRNLFDTLGYEIVIVPKQGE